MPKKQSIKISNKLYQLRWLALFIFILGYIATFTHFPNHTIEYFSLTFICIIACFVLLAKLNRPFINNLPIWIILSVLLVAYFLKFYMLIIFIDFMEIKEIATYYHYLVSENVMYETFFIMSSAFFVFCMTAWVIIEFSHISIDTSKTCNVDYKSLIPSLQILIIVLILITSFITYLSGASRMGADTVELPFRLSGWLYNIRVTLLPLLLLLLISSADNSGIHKHLRIAIILLLIHGISDILLRSSRGALLNIAIMLSMLFIIKGRVTRKGINLVLAVVLVTILAFPFLTVYRANRAKNDIQSVVTSLEDSIFEVSFYSQSYLDTLLKTIISMSNRLVGSEALLVAATNDSPLGFDFLNISVHNYFTFHVLGVPPHAITGFAPSLLGWLYLIGELNLVIVGMFLYVFMVWIIWKTLLKTNLCCREVALAFFLFLLIGYSSGGIPNRFLLDVIISISSIAACEIIMRSFVKKKRLRFLYEQQNN